MMGEYDEVVNRKLAVRNTCCRDFSCFYNCDRYNYYIIINRGKVSGISYSVDEIYDFVKDGKNHYIRKSCRGGRRL